MNVRQKIIESLKGQKNATIATVAKATGIDRTVVRYHVRAMAKVGLVKVGRGTSGPNGSAPVSILNTKKAVEFAADFEPRKNGRSLGGGKRPKRAAGARRGKRANGIGTSPKNGNGEVFLVTHTAQNGGLDVLAVSIFNDQDTAVSATVDHEGACIYAARQLRIVHTLEG